MATAESVKTKIQDLISSANAATGNSDTDMTAAVAALIAGFGTGGGTETIYCGTYISETRMSGNVEFSTPGGVSHFAIFMTESPALDTGMAFTMGIMGCADSITIQAGSNNGGTTTTSMTTYAIGKAYSYYPGISFETDSVQILASGAAEQYRRAFAAGKTYVWAAW